MKKTQPTSPAVAKLFQQGISLHRQGQLTQAKNFYEQVLAKQPKHFDALNMLGVIASQANNHALAAELMGKAIEINPNSASAYSNRGLVLQELKRTDEALVSFDKAIALKPDYAEAFNNRGAALKDLKRPGEALVSFDKAIALKPNYVQAFNNRGTALQDLKRQDDALTSYDKAIALKPDYAQAFNNRGASLQELKRLGEALVSYDKAITLQPDYAEAVYNRGNTLKDLRRLDEALMSFDKAIGLKPDYAEAINNRGAALQDLRRLDEALMSFDKAIALKPDYAEAFNNRGGALQTLKRLDEALASYDKAIALKPDYAEAFYNRGNALKDLSRLDESLVSFDSAFALKPDYEFLLGMRLHTMLHLCDWSDLPNQLPPLEAGLSKARMVADPFPVLGLIDNPELQLCASKIYADAKYPASDTLGDFTKRLPGGKIRIAYYSADFQIHVVADLIVELLELHDSHHFEVYGFSFGDSSNDEMRQRIANVVDHFIDVRTKSDSEVAQMSRSLGIDIAIDLGGYTKDSRTGIFAARCAPIQVNYLGYPGTMGASYMDYIVADKIMIPQENQQHFSEKIVYLPHSFQVNDSKRQISDKAFTKQELGLPESGFVFCCFNNNYKILPETFNSWMRLLKVVSGSVLWLYAEQPTAVKNLQKEAAARGVDPSRLVFAKRMKGDDHLARQSVADLFLDTLPFNAGATASAALWSGLPILTVMGESFTARYAASLLNAMDLPELITATQEEYEARAIKLANEPARLAEIKKKLHNNLKTSPLFNGELFARHIEVAYAEMHKRYLSGAKPDHIYVAA
jgi:protein O-GlcNAc transferase